jgi:hypothetical protein
VIRYSVDSALFLSVVVGELRRFAISSTSFYCNPARVLHTNPRVFILRSWQSQFDVVVVASPAIRIRGSVVANAVISQWPLPLPCSLFSLAMIKRVSELRNLAKTATLRLKDGAT